ncbi:MAG: arabinan endo-1,5-alpha-L-arabinosidase [Ruminococcaceae bacterium]|jgi:beta-xylosidase|nr:arabinan endo-1,5-alpha-L-arabinosidase [Oscillospiraceae bacterium]
MRFTVHNPLDEGWYADPEARFYEGRYYIYVTHSLPYDEQLNHTCFVSDDLTNWEKIENIIDMSGFPWVKAAVWAPTIEEVGGKYYYIFASNDVPHKSEVGGLEIAVSDSPAGPFRALLDRPLVGEFHNGAQPIDAHLFKDDDGTVYLYYGGWGHCNIVKMNAEMTGFVPFEDGVVFREITPPDYVEGPCMLKRNGRYHFMWSAGGWTDGSYRVNTATSDKPWGPFETARTILSTGDSKIANGPGHNGFLYLPEEDRYLMVYHRHKPGLRNGNARFLCIDRMDLDENGEILPVTMTENWTYDSDAESAGKAE